MEKCELNLCAIPPTTFAPKSSSTTENPVEPKEPNQSEVEGALKKTSLYYESAVLYFDGACKNNPYGHAGAGFLLQISTKGSNESKKILEGFVYLGIAVSQNEAEYDGLLAALETMKDRNISVGVLNVFGNSKLVINQVNKVFRVRSARMRPRYEKTKRLLEGENNIEKYTISQVSKIKNFATSNLAQKAIKNQYSWTSDTTLA